MFRLENKSRNIDLSTNFIKYKLPKANATFVKVYLYGLFVCSENLSHKNKDIASVLGILESDVINAWKYWEKENVVKIHQKNEMEIEFLDIDDIRDNIKKSFETRPSYTTDEIVSEVEKSKSMQKLFNVAQKKLRRLLSTRDFEILYGMHDWIGLDIDAIILLLEYCAKLEKRSIRYIETIAIDWAKRGITDLNSVTAHVKNIEEKKHALYSIRNILGIENRTLTDKEIEVFEKWIYLTKTKLDLIKKAFDMTINNTGKLSVAYMDKIIMSWHEKGIDSVDKANKHTKEYKNNNKYEAKTKTSFSNFTERDYGYDELEKLAMDKAKAFLKG